MGKVIMSGIVPQLVKPKIPGIVLSEIAEGGIVKINENGSPVEFYVAKHNYESGLNGAGRTLLVRKNVYDQRKWNTQYNTYADSLIDIWLNSDYKKILPDNVQEAIATTSFYYTIGNTDPTITTLSRSVFILSHTELGLSNSGFNVEGSPLPIASMLRSGYLNGETPNYQWTRTPQIHVADGNTTNQNYVAMTSGGSNNSWPASTETNWSRPCFTLPNSAVFDENTFILKGVA